MEEYSLQLSENASSRGSGGAFVYGGGPVLAPSSSLYARTSSGSSNHHGGGGFHLQSGDCYDQGDGHHHTAVVKTEAGTSQNHAPRFQYPSIIRGHENLEDHHHHHHEFDHRRTESESNPIQVDAIKAKIIAHPQYSNLLEAYMDCQKVAPFFNKIIQFSFHD